MDGGIVFYGGEGRDICVIYFFVFLELVMGLLWRMSLVNVDLFLVIVS